jgi:hypothetical protein
MMVAKSTLRRSVLLFSVTDNHLQSLISTNIVLFNSVSISEVDVLEIPGALFAGEVT